MDELKCTLKRQRTGKLQDQMTSSSNSTNCLTMQILPSFSKLLIIMWKTQNMIFLHGTTSVSNSSKKGDLSLPKNYHPISILDVLSKILSSIMVSRMNDHLNKWPKKQAGLLHERSRVLRCNHYLKMTLQNLQAANQDSFLLFVDIVKTFDSVNRDMLWKILKKY